MIEEFFNTAKEWGFNQLRDTGLGIVESMLALSMVALNPLFPAVATPLSSSFRMLVMGVYGLAVCIGGVVVMTSESLQERYSAREIVPRLIAGFMLSYFSPNIIWFVQGLNTDLVVAFTLGEAMSDSTDGTGFLDLLAIEARSAPVTLIDLLVALLKLVAAFMLWLCMLTRDIAWFIVAVFAPIALATHALPFTEGLAWLWWRMLWACFFSSVGQAALIWVWMNIYTDLTDIEVLAYYSLGPFYMLVLTWVAWRLHKDLFIWAKGSPMRLPGGRLVKAAVGSVVGIALFKSNPAGRLASYGLQRFRNWRGQTGQTPPAPPPPPSPRSGGPPRPGPPSGPAPRPRPTPPSPGQPALGEPPLVTGDTEDHPPQRPGRGPVGEEQLPPGSKQPVLEAGPVRLWRTGSSPDRPPERPKAPPAENIEPTHDKRPATTSPADENASRWERLRRRWRTSTLPPEQHRARPGRGDRPAPRSPVVIDADPSDTTFPRRRP